MVELLDQDIQTKEILKWKPKITFENLVSTMVENDLEQVTNLKY